MVSRYNQIALASVHVNVEHLSVKHKLAYLMDLPVLLLVILTIRHMIFATLISKEIVNIQYLSHVAVMSLIFLFEMKHTMIEYHVLIK